MPAPTSGGVRSDAPAPIAAAPTHAPIALAMFSAEWLSEPASWGAVGAESTSSTCRDGAIPEPLTATQKRNTIITGAHGAVSATAASETALSPKLRRRVPTGSRSVRAPLTSVPITMPTP